MGDRRLRSDEERYASTLATARAVAPDAQSHRMLTRDSGAARSMRVAAAERRACAGPEGPAAER